MSTNNAYDHDRKYPLVEALYAYFNSNNDNHLVLVEKELMLHKYEERFGYFNNALLDMLIVYQVNNSCIIWGKGVRQSMCDIGFMCIPECLNDEQDIKGMKSRISTAVDNAYFEDV